VGFFDKLFGKRTIEAREAEFAGDVYPEGPNELEREVRGLLAAASSTPVPGLRALIAPHAAYEFAGPVMAEAYASVAADEQDVNRVVVLGSSRLVPFRGLALDSWEGFETPLGVLEYPTDGFWDDAPAHVRRMAAAFDPEESIEAQLPFVQVIFDDVQLVPVLVGDATAGQVADALEWLLDDRALVVLSANLSYDVTLDRAEALDAHTEDAILAGQPDEITRDHSTSRVAMRGLLALAKKRGWSARCLARSNSREQGGGADNVVGYGAFAFS
ncbi:MAG: AmmeMemoRadiSam system protein B, partial [Myxococcota bacterium]